MPERRVARTGTLAAAALALVLTACGSSGGATSSGPATTGSAVGGAVTSSGVTSAAAGTTAAGTAGGTTGSAASTPAAPAEAPAVLKFQAPLLAGGALDGTTYTGKPVAFWFWAPW